MKNSPALASAIISTLVLQFGQVVCAHSSGVGGAYDDHGISDLDEMLNHTGYFNYIAQRDPNDPGRMMSQGDNIVLVNEAAPNQTPTASLAYYTLVNPHSFENGSLSSFNFVDILISPTGASYHDASLEQYLSGFTVNPFIHGLSGSMDILWTRNGTVVHKNHASWNFEKNPCEPCGAAGCRLSAELNSIHLKIPLGDFAFGKESSDLTFDSEVLANPGPSALKFAGRTGADASTVNRTNGVIASVMTGNSIASVTAAPSAGDANRFEISFTYIDDPRPQPADAVYRKVSVEKIGAVVWVTEVGNGASRTYAYANPVAGTWTMEESGLRRTSKEEIHSDDPKARITRRRTEEKGADDQWKSIALEEVHEHKFRWGWEVVRSILDPDGSALATGHDYYDYDDAATSNPSLVAMGKLKQEDFPSGLIRQYEYFSTDPYLPGYSQVDVVREAFGASLAKETRIHKKYVAGTFTSLEEVWVAGFMVSKKEIIATAGSRIEKVYPSATGQPLVTTTTDSNGALEATYPDGTVRKVINSVSNGQLTETIYEGVKNPNAGHFLLNGTESIRVLTRSGDVQRTALYRIHSGVAYRVEERITVAKDPMGRPESVNVFAGNKQGSVYSEYFSYSCCGLAQETGRDGITGYHYYDRLGRRWKTHRNGISEETAWDGLVTRFHRFAEGLPSAAPGALPENEISETVRDLTGVETLRLERSPKDGSLISSSTQTIHCPEAGIGKRVILVGPATTDDQGETATIIEEYFPDGRLRERRGSLVTGVRMAYAVNATGVMETSSKISSTGASFESRTTQKDWAGREITTLYSGDKNGDAHPDSANFFYDGTGRVIKAVDPDGVTRMYSHSVGTGVEIAAIDRNGNGVIDSTVDEISIHREGVGLNGSGDVVQWTEEACRSTDAQGAGVEVMLARSETNVDGLNAQSFVYGGAQTAASKWSRRDITPGQWEITNAAADGTSTTDRFQSGLLIEQTGLSADDSALFQRTFSYDSMQRPVQITDSRGPATTCQYVSPHVDLVSMVSVGGRVSSFGYDERGRTTLNDEPDSLDSNGAVVSNSRITHYWPDGNVREQLGSPGYRTSYTYDAAQRLETLTTYGAHPSVTRWEYDSDRGWLVAKRYNSPAPGQGNGESYAYTAGGRLKTKSLARGVDIHYSYDAAGNQLEIEYSDGTHPVTFGETDQRGRPHRIIDASGERIVAYDAWGELASQGYQSGVFSSAWSVSHTRDFIGRLAGLRVFQGGSGLPLHEISYGRDAAGRVTSVASGGKSASYHYDTLHQRVSQIGLAENAIPVLVATLQYDGLSRLERISYHNGKTSGPFNLHSDERIYRDEFGNIERIDSKDGKRQIYRYNAAGELASARCQTEGNAVLSGQSFDWSYDGVGNRLSCGRGGDVQGDGLRETSYIADPSHQYATILNPGAADVIGLAAPGDAVTVNGEAALRQGNFFHHEVSASNGAGCEWRSITVGNGSKTKSGALLIPPADQQQAYDADGNLTSDGIRAFTWDAENRLAKIEILPAAVARGVPYQRVENVYDSEGRRIQRARFDSASAMTAVEITRYLWAGWRCLVEIDGNDILQKRLAWGLDQHQPLHLGDGNGALLWTTDSNGVSQYFRYDANGNVVGLSNAASVSTAEYTYSAFGELIGKRGPYADANNYRFSTKPFEEVGNLYYYGYRFYDPVNGRWLSRDPLGEAGGVNVHGFLGNRPTMDSDVLGMYSFAETAGNQASGAWSAEKATVYYAMVDSKVDLAKAAWGAVTAMPKLSYSIFNARLEFLGQESYYLRHMSLYDYGEIWTERNFRARDMVETIKENLRNKGWRDAQIDAFLRALYAKFQDPECVEKMLRSATAEATLLAAGMAAEAVNFASKAEALDIEALDFTTEANKAVFYSGPGNRARALSFADKSGATPIDLTPGGKYLESLKLYDRLPAAEADAIWAKASQKYAEGASGRINLFTNGARPDRVFHTIEAPSIKANPNIYQQTFHY